MRMWLSSLWYGSTFWLVPLVSGRKDLGAVLKSLEKLIMLALLDVSSWPTSTAKLLWSLRQSLTILIGGLLFSMYYVFVYVVLFRSFLQVLVDPSVTLMYSLVLGGCLCCGWVLNCYFWGIYEWGIRRHGLAPFFLGCVAFGLALLAVLWGVASIPVVVGVFLQMILAILIPRVVGQTWFSYLSKQARRLDMSSALLDQFESAKLMGLVSTICRELNSRRVEEFTALERAKYYLVLIQFLGSIVGALSVWSGVFLLSKVYVDSFTVANVSAGMVSVWIIGKSVWIFQGLFMSVTTCSSCMKIGEELCSPASILGKIVNNGNMDVKFLVVSVQKARDSVEICSVCSKPVFNKADCLFVNGASVHASCLQKTKVSDLASKSSKRTFDHTHSLICGVCSGAILEKDFLEINGVLFHLHCVEKLDHRPNLCAGCDTDASQVKFLCSKCKRKFCQDCLVPMSDGRNFCRRLCVSQFGILIGPWSCSIERGSKICILSARSLQANAVLLKSLITGKDVISGTLQIGGQVAMCFEQVFILPQSSIRENILFGRCFDSQRYDIVLHACALNIDFATLVDQDQTLLIDNGGNLSGGQIRRIGLARALYADADIVFFEDPFQGLDQKTSRHFLKEGIFGVLKNKTVIISSSFRVPNFGKFVLINESGQITQEDMENVEDEGVFEKEKSETLASDAGSSLACISGKGADSLHMSTKDAALQFLKFCSQRFALICILLVSEMGSGVAAFYLFSFWLNERRELHEILNLKSRLEDTKGIFSCFQDVPKRKYLQSGFF